MSVTRIMNKEVVTVAEDITVRSAARILQHARYSSLPVTDEEGRLVGEFGDEQLLRFALPEYAFLTESLAALPENFEPYYERLEEAAEMRVRDVMVPAHSVPHNTSLVAALALIADEGIEELFVESDGKLVGVVTRSQALDRVIYPTLLRDEVGD